MNGATNGRHQEVPTLQPGIYEHYKGSRYEVVGVGVHSESLEPMVIYKPLYESMTKFFVRPYDMFIEIVEINGDRIPRFKKID